MTDDTLTKPKSRLVASPPAPPASLLYTGPDWNFETLGRIFDAVREIGEGEMGLDTYRTQIEVITSEQMLDAYSSVGMPLFYKHWSFGKDFARNEALYRKGWQGLAYEIVINSDPCICYIMEENSATMQTLVLAHAATATAISSRTITSSSSGPTPRASPTIFHSPRATSPSARSATARRRSSA